MNEEQAKALFVAHNCLAASILAAGRKVTAIYDDALRPLGLTVSQFNMLAAIILVRPKSISALANAIGMERSTASRNMAILTRNGWVAKMAADNGQSGTIFDLTGTGREKFEMAQPIWKNVQDDLSARLGNGVADEIRRLLKIFSNLPHG